MGAPRILFVKTSSLGDVVHHCPALTDAARRLPGAVIDWVVEEPFAGVAALHPALRRAIPVRLRSWRRAPWRPAVWAQVRDSLRELRAERYDVVIDTQGLLKSALIGLAAQGERHGFDRASAREPIAARFYHVRHAVARTLHAVERNRRLVAAALGYALEDACDYGLQAPAAVDGAGTARAVLLTMTSRSDKLWREADWIELAQALRARRLEVVLPWGSDLERLRCERIARESGATPAPRRLAIGELAGLLGAARLVIGLDTGLSHLAVALKVPTLGIYTGTDPALTGLHGSAHARNLGAAGRPPSVAEVLRALEGFA